MAAWLIKFANSAPEKPVVPLAKVLTLTSLPIWIFFIWVSIIFSRPLRSGNGTLIWRSNLPGLINALSRASIWLVAAINITPSDELKLNNFFFIFLFII